MGQLNKEALNEFLDNVITPVLVKNEENLKLISEKSYPNEESFYQLPFIERRNMYRLQEKINELNGENGK